MGQAVSKIKDRIKTVSSAYKVTSAMKLVSTVKLKTWRNKMLANKEFMDLSKETIEEILRCENINSFYTQVNEKAKKSLYIVVTSSLGLCGSYNSNIFRIIDSSITKDDEVIILGEKGATHYINGEFKINEDFAPNSSIHDKNYVNKLVSYVLREYKKEAFREVHLIYSEYKNSLVFIAKDFVLLPLKSSQVDDNRYSPLMEPSRKELVETLVPIYIKNIIYSKFLESAVCEEASRSNAMENATNNAKEILDDLKIEFNKARQGAITQEIIEIVSASKAV